MKAILALASLTLIGAAPDRNVSPFFINQALVQKVECGGLVGSSARISGDIAITATHVSAVGGCSIGGSPISEVHVGKGLDFSAVSVVDDGFPHRLPVSCEGVKEGKLYLALGYAYGGPLVIEAIRGTRDKHRSGEFKGMAVFKGRTHPGMSGGPIINERGEMVAIVNAGNPHLGMTLGRSMRDTYLCAD